MLSFDITDRNIRIVKGVEGNGKIKITSAVTLNLEEEVIVNGHVKDVPRVATLINSSLRKSKMADKEAIVSISSNLTIFKELHVPKVKSQEMPKTVKQQMQAELNLDDSYSVSYIIVGDAESQDGDKSAPMLKILATACPIEIINCYRDVFKMLNISLKSVMIGCNCITKVLLADTKIKSKMPLLAVQIDNNFISLNLYEQGQLSFSRFASIDATDYGNSDDYVFEAVNENIFRMLQFHKSRSTGEVIENVVFYGDTHEYVRLTDELEKLDLKTSLINVPPQIHGHENLEFSLYANAIGAMFKRNKDTEKINLLESDGAGTLIRTKGKSSGGGSSTAMLIVCAVCALAVGGVWFGLTAHDNSIKDEIQGYRDDIASPETAEKLALYDRLVTMETKVNTYNAMIVNADDAFYSQPVILGEKFDLIETVVANTASETNVGEAKIITPKYADGTFTFDVECGAVADPSQKLPAKFVENLLKEKDFAVVAYSKYDVVEVDASVNENGETIGDGGKQVKFSITINITGRESAYNPPEVEDESDDSSEEGAE